MNIFQAFNMAIKSIGSNKVRTLLTMLGIIIGVSSVIILVSLGEGSTKAITERIQGMGTNLINVRIMGRNSNRSVSEDELMNLAYSNDDVIEAVVPSLEDQATVKYGTNNLQTSLIGTSEGFETARNTKVEDGRFFSALDVDRRQKVVLLGTYVANELFEDVSPIGEKIKINGEIYAVVGILEEKSSSAESSEDDRVIIPYTTAKRLVRNANITTFYVQAKTPETVDSAVTKLEEFLFKKFNSEDAYRVLNQAEMLDTINETTKTMSMLLGGIAGISLVVGGIGIMNIMLVSVTERTREIGIRKAIGAKRRNILVQFLIESIVVSCFGGLIGVAFGYMGSQIIGKVMSVAAQPSIMTILFSFSFSAVVGIFFGFYPASKASKLNPIEALRFE